MKGEKIGSEERKGKGDSLVLQTTSWRIGIALFFFPEFRMPYRAVVIQKVWPCYRNGERI